MARTTDAIGRFDLGEVPSGVPLTIQARSFGYLPVSPTFEPQQDTTLILALVDDPVMQRIISEKMTLIDARLEDRRYKYLPLIDRDKLMEFRDPSWTCSRYE